MLYRTAMKKQFLKRWESFSAPSNITTTSRDTTPVVRLFSSDEEAYGFILSEETRTYTKYVALTSRNIGVTDLASLDGRKIHWEDKDIPFDGVPFIILGTETRECQHASSRPGKKIVSSDADHNQCNKKHRKLFQNSKKQDCPARIRLRKIIKFPEMKLEENSNKWRRSELSRRLREAFPNTEKVYKVFIEFPSMEDHHSHLTGKLAEYAQHIDARLVQKIGELVGEGVTNIGEMKRCIRSYAEKELLTPDANISEDNRRFYPTDRDIRNHMHRALTETRYSSNDQENLRQNILRWKHEAQDDSFFFRPASPDDSDNPESLLFIHQTAWQKRLLARYGNEMCLMDATYNTTAYDLPLFFVCVYTNVGFSIVASFLLGKETKANISEAIVKLSQWNPQWLPTHFICDYDTREIGAIEDVFNGCLVYICDFHREQAWDRWLSKTRNGVAEHKRELLTLLRSVARSRTVEEYKDSVTDIRSHEIFKKCPTFSKWLESTWLKQHQRWVKAFRMELVNMRVTTTNGLERQHRELKEHYLKSHAKGTSLTGMIDILVNSFLPDAFRRYKRYNIESLDLFRSYASSVPHFLRNRPRRFLAHCMARMTPSIEVIQDRHIRQGKEEGEFSVTSPESGVTYQLKLAEVLPSCSCPDWQTTHWPCKHMLAVFQAHPANGWDFLHPEYTGSPFFNLDIQDPDRIERETSEPVCSPQTQGLVKARIQKTVETRQLCLEKMKNITSGIYGASEGRLHEILSGIQTLEDIVTRSLETVQGLPIRHMLKRKIKFKKTSLHKKPRLSTEQDVEVEGLYDMDELISSNEAEQSGGTDGEPTGTSSQQTQHEPSVCRFDAEVDSIWTTNTDDRVLGKVGPFTITSKSIRALKRQLTDEVMDAYMHLLSTKHSGSLHINSVFATAIFNGNTEIHGLLRQVDLYRYENVLAAVNENGDHWTLMIILPKKRTIMYINPLGETHGSEQRLIQNWYGFMKRRYQFGIDRERVGLWEMHSPAHARQRDSISCGVFVLKIAEEFLCGKSLLFNLGNDALRRYRRHIAVSILSNTEALPVRSCFDNNQRNYQLRKAPVKKVQKDFQYPSLRSRRKTHCICKKADDGEVYWQCDRCNKWFHPLCIGEKRKTEPRIFKCLKCQTRLLDLPDEILANVFGWVILGTGDSAYLGLSLVCKRFNQICAQRSFQRKCHLSWLLSIKPRSFWIQENNKQFFVPFSIVECETCRQAFKEEGPGFWGGKGRQGHFVGWYDELSHPGFCSVICRRLYENY